MINLHNNNILLFKDGSSRQSSALDSLDPSFARAENRSKEELILEARAIARELSFFNEKNEKGTDSWEPFFLSEDTGGRNSDARAKQWAAELVAYMENPEVFQNDEEKLKRLSQPHTVLFSTFLSLLNHIKSQINGLTKKHLDFYFYERLKLKPREAQPDVVNILLELAENAIQLEIKEGTVFIAGTDSDGNELQYSTTEDTVINKGKVDQLKSVFVDKVFTTIEEMHLKYRDNQDDVLQSMFELALGVPRPGDSLPAMPVNTENLSDLYALVLEHNEAAKTYVNQQLYLSVTSFDFIMKVHQSKNHLASEWPEVFRLLNTAYQSKVKNERRKTFKGIHENESFYALLRYVYGVPNPGNSLPFYNGQEMDFAELFNDLRGDEIQKSDASEFIEEELKLSIPDFIFIHEVDNKTASAEDDWNRVYQILEVANRQYRQLIIQNPSIERIINIYAAEDIRSLAFRRYEEDAESLRFKTFGNLRTDSENSLKPAKLGYGISSPILSMKEGERVVTLLHDLEIEPDDFKSFSKLLGKDIFSIWLSGENGWFEPEDIHMTTGCFVNKNPVLELLISSVQSIDGSDQVFGISIDESIQGNVSPEVIGNAFIVDTDRNIYELQSVNSAELLIAKKVNNTVVAESEFTKTGLYDAKDVYLQGFKIIVTLTENTEEVAPLTEHVSEIPRSSEIPSLLFQVNNNAVVNLISKNEIAVFDNVMSANVKKIHLRTLVSGLKKSVIQNDRGSLNPKKPFEPFGSQPEVGSNFYFTHEELSEKVISKLKVKFDWMNLPQDFGAYYENYIDSSSSNTSSGNAVVNSESDFKVNLFLQEDFNEMLIVKETELFPENYTLDVDNIVEKLAQSRPGFRYDILTEEDQSTNEITSWRRYFKLELTPTDFQHQLYNKLIFQNAGIDGQALNQPYVPKLRNISFEYESETEIFSEHSEVDENALLFQIHPFGYKDINDRESLALIPEYRENGSLMLRISDIQAGQNISILFQLAEGSANPDVDKPELQWSYLKNNVWYPIGVGDLISDTTQGLRKTGIIKLRIPKEASSGGSLLPGSGYWIKMSVVNQIDGISDTIDIRGQVLSARLSSNDVAGSHYNTPLSPGSVVETEEFFPEIVSIEQPYTSLLGKSAEDNGLFYRRISERIRHKNRALTIWDYEQLVLENFPEIFKVKCLPALRTPGEVILTVIPDIREKLPFDPFTPKVSSETLSNISDFLSSRISAHACLQVRNPYYSEVKIRCTVKFHAGFDQLFFQSKLNEELKRFLSPWAYDEANEIRIGGILESGVLINFIAEKEYVDFVANLRIFQTIDGETSDVTVLNNGRNAVIPHRPDMVITSSEVHQIDLVDENEYDEDSETGINYMVIEEDFIVAEDLLK